jgi:hypothetical protein
MHIQIDLDRVRETAYKGIRRTAVFLGLGLNASFDPSFQRYELADLSPIRLVPSDMPEETIAHFKSEFGRWIIACGLRELIERFAIFLDETHHACLLMATHKGTVSLEDATAWQSAFHYKGVDDKLKKFENRFSVCPRFPQHISTIQKLRNCFTHRRGIVGVEDCNGTDQLELKWMGFKLVAEHANGQTVELSMPLKEPIHFPEGGTIGLQFIERARYFKIDMLVTIEPKDLLEICNFVLMSTDEIIRSVVEFAKRLGIKEALAERDESRPS